MPCTQDVNITSHGHRTCVCLRKFLIQLMALEIASNAFVSHSADARSSSVDGMYVVPGKITGLATSARRREQSGVWVYFGELRYRLVQYFQEIDGVNFSIY